MFKLFLKPIAIILSALIISAVIGGALIYKSNNENEADTDATIDKDLPSVTEEKEIERPFCVLIIGKDRVSSLADVIMLASFDKSTKKACSKTFGDTMIELASENNKIVAINMQQFH